MKYYIKTFGCQMNVHESEKLAGMLQSLGYTHSVKTPENSDIIIFNTCCIRDGVEQKIMGNIGALKKLKKRNPNLIIAICGCMSQAEGRDELIRKKFPFVDIIFGTHNIHRLKDLITKHNLEKQHITEVWEKEQGIFENVEMSRDCINSNAWVNINYGCNNFCAYCIVPYVRGRERSRDMNDILLECQDLIRQGFKYITLLGQNVNSYGNDIDDDNVNFANLLSAVASLDGDFRVKFMTSHPKDLSEEVIDTIANNNKICKVIHLPIQSGSNDVLYHMNRKYTREHYLQLIAKIRAKIPNAYISTDIIVGFPGESEKDFMDTYNLVNEVRYDGVFAFMYSKRTGTVAEKMPNQIDESVKKDRIHKLLNLTKQITKEKDIQSIGQEYNVLTIRHEGNFTVALSDSGKTILVDGICDINTFYTVTTTQYIDNKLYAKIIG